MVVLSTLKDLKFSSSQHGPITEYKALISLLRQKYIPGVDKWKEFKKYFVDQKIKDSLILLHEEQYVNFGTIIKFAYQCKDVLQFCNDITKEIEDHLIKCGSLPTQQERIPTVETEKRIPTVETVKDVYDIVSKTDFTIVQESKGLQLHFDTVPSLYDIYRGHFTEEQLDKILFFEYHFDHSHPSSKDKNIGEQVKLKYNFLVQCQETRRLGETLSKQHFIVTKERKQRKEETDVVQGLYVKGNSRHFTEVIDLDLSSSVEELFSQKPALAIAVNCSGFCTHKKGLHVLIALEKEVTEDNLIDLAASITSTAREQHNDDIIELLFVSKKGLSQYENEYGVFQRFRYFDDICQGRLSDDILLVCKPTDIRQDTPNDDDEYCKRCYQRYGLKPLHWKTFDIDEEWSMGVPLQMQILLETFLNLKSLSRSTIDSFIRGKLTKLYTLYDSLLNIFNRKHFGVIQDLFTNELIYNYHNVTTVFAITSQTGVTRSLSSAEKILKQNSDSDYLYWDSFIRDHELGYDTDGGFLTQSISLRNCHLVLGLDNLVRLTFTRDPERGQTKSNQVCTLPITIKGLPADSSTALSWHDDETCDGRDVCSCKMQKQLDQCDFEDKILHRTESEQEKFDKFDKFMTWSQETIWIHRLNDKDGFDLNMSIDALHLNEENVENEKVGDEIPLKEDDEDLESLTASEQEAIESLSEISSISDTDSDDDDIHPLLSSSEEPLASSDDDDSETDDVHGLDTNNVEQSILEDFVPLATVEYQEIDCPTTSVFPFDVYETPPMVEKHPPPATGKDDDIKKLREVLDDIIIKSGKGNRLHQDQERILFAPDNTIGKNLIKLVQEYQKYRLFLPEFPLLHLRKSKIINLFSAYKSAGLVKLLMYMHGEDTNDWMKLIGITHVETATRNIRRLAVTFHIVMMELFLDSLSDSKRTTLQKILSGKAQFSEEMNSEYQAFITRQSEDDPTFTLHLEMMQHCDEIVAIYTAERIGGRDGYLLLLASVKSSLPFSFLNGASSYAAFCMHLLQEHYSCGRFWQEMKMCLFSTKYKDSSVNIALDTQREMDHREALKGFRPRAGLSAILPRMSLVDMYDDVVSAHSSIFEKTTPEESSSQERKVKIFNITSKDARHILPTVNMMVGRLKSFSSMSHCPFNIYSAKPEMLSECVLDKRTNELGVHLMYQYAARESMFTLTQKDMPSIPETAPKDLSRKVKLTKGTTVKRSTCKPNGQHHSLPAKEKKRQQKVLRMKKTFDRMSSDMNLLQAVLLPFQSSCSKVHRNKSSHSVHSQGLFDTFNQQQSDD